MEKALDIVIKLARVLTYLRPQVRPAARVGIYLLESGCV
jgi:hypothetical protein